MAKKKRAKKAAKKKAKKKVAKRTTKKKAAKRGGKKKVAGKKAAKKRRGKAAAAPRRAGAEDTEKCLVDAAKKVHGSITRGKKPELTSPTRALSNVRYDERVGYFELGRGRKHRTLTYNTVKSFAQTLKMMALSRETILENTHVTKREAYYVSKNWEEAKFDEQPESDTVMDDIEAMFSDPRCQPRTARAFIPDEHGGSGRRRADRDTTRNDRDRPHRRRSTARASGSGAYSIPVARRAPRRSRPSAEVRPLPSRPAACSSGCRATSFWRDRRTASSIEHRPASRRAPRAVSCGGSRTSVQACRSTRSSTAIRTGSRTSTAP